MMSKMNYIYFELRYLQVGAEKPLKVIENENILVNPPHTNSDGVWGFLNMTKRHRSNEVEHMVVDQYWVDLTKYKPKSREIDEHIKLVISKLNVEDDA